MFNDDFPTYVFTWSIILFLTWALVVKLAFFLGLFRDPTLSSLRSLLTVPVCNYFNDDDDDGDVHGSTFKQCIAMVYIFITQINPIKNE